MTLPDQPTSVLRFGVFEANLRAGELRRNGIRLKLQEKPFQLLAILLEQPGEVVAKEDLQRRLWPDVTVDADSGLIEAAYKLRQALDDSAQAPRYIETIPKRGYRFVAAVEPRVDPKTPPKPKLDPKPRLLAALLGIATIALSIVAVIHVFEAAPERRVRKFSFEVMAEVVNPGRPTELQAAVSPDGRYVAYANQKGLWVRDLEQFHPPRLLYTSKGFLRPFWSPGSDFIGFVVAADLMKIPLEGGEPELVCRMPSDHFQGGAWSADGEVIVFAADHTRVLHQVNAGGSEALPVFSDEDLARMTAGAAKFLQSQTPPMPHIAFPSFLPAEAGGRVLLMELGFGGLQTMMALDLETGRRAFLGRGTRPTFAPSGHLVYVGGGDLWAISFSLNTLQTSGNPFRVALNTEPGPSVARDGTLVYADRPQRMRRLVWFDRSGRPTGVIGDPSTGLMGAPRISPDGRRIVAMSKGDRTQVIWPHVNHDIWLYDSVPPTAPRRLNQAESAAVESYPIWSPTGEEVAFGSDVEGEMNIFFLPVDGREATPMAPSDARQRPWDWSPDGRYILFRSNHLETGYDLWYAERGDDGNTWETKPFLTTPAGELAGKFSPDGRYVAYISNETGRSEVYICSFPDGHGKQQISMKKGRGIFAWSRDTGELFYVEGDAEGWSVVAVRISTDPELSVGDRTPLFRMPKGQDTANLWDASPRGDGFVRVEPVGEAPRPAIRVVQNWYEEFRSRPGNAR